MAKILTLHPDPGKSGVNIDQEKYELFKSAILARLKLAGDQTFTDLAKCLEEDLTGFDGSVAWYTVTVKLDLEARGLLRHDRSANPALISIAINKKAPR